jgi:RNase P protein component
MVNDTWKRHRPEMGPGGPKCPCCGYAVSKKGDRRIIRTRIKRETRKEVQDY